MNINTPLHKQLSLTHPLPHHMDNTQLLHALSTSPHETAEKIRDLLEADPKTPFTPFIETLNAVKILMEKWLTLSTSLVDKKIFKDDIHLARARDLFKSLDITESQTPWPNSWAEVSIVLQTHIQTFKNKIKECERLINQNAPFTESMTFIWHCFGEHPGTYNLSKETPTPSLLFIKLPIFSNTPFPTGVLDAGNGILPIQICTKDLGSYDYTHHDVPKDTYFESSVTEKIKDEFEFGDWYTLLHIFRYIDHDFTHAFQTTRNRLREWEKEKLPDSNPLDPESISKSHKESANYYEKIRKQQSILNHDDDNPALALAFEFLVFQIGHEEATMGSWAPDIINHLLSKGCCNRDGRGTLDTQIEAIKLKLDPRAKKTFYAEDKYKTIAVIEQLEAAGQLLLDIYKDSSKKETDV